MEEIVVSAPGKIILHGEHAVVYGKIALAAALNLRSYLKIKQKNDGQVTVNLPNIGINKTWKLSDLQQKISLPLCDPLKPFTVTDDQLSQLKQLGGINPDSNSTTDLAVIAFLYLYMCITACEGELCSVEVTVSSNLPVSAGLGSSAGYSVCLAASLLQIGGLIPPSNSLGKWSEQHLKLINDWAFQGEKIIHGNPSGIDNSISTYGGAIKFQGGKITPVEKMPKLRILLVNTKVPRSTKILVAGVRDKYNKYREVMEPILNSTECITVQCESVLSDIANNPTPESYNTLQDLIDINQHLLQAMGVSHPALEKIIRLTSQYNLHSKLTGAGGGGCSFTLIPPGTAEETIVAIKIELEKLGYDCWETSVGATGVCNEKRDAQLPTYLS
ncbi:hypothetical protein LOTGIDRAFT_231588 [Lottia gigantea]|uniref:Mevalonate kinase n=1 Tax=Lottia gigantea TaxID=225164 RepID=V4A0T9_LOTGI|nr:hypothetical protein LOTGIDRAFT_231588 [Lottia gigantea]ESO97418.1 hypothetical protein LOTGIDRAFT_231588 [Lottia gigantea]